MRNSLTQCLVLLSLTVAVAATAGEGRGKFVRVTEQPIDGREQLGIIVRPLDRDEPVTLIVPPAETAVGEELRARVRRLREGQLVEFAYREEGGHRWARDIRPVREVEPNREERREAVREPAGRGGDVERQLAEMREEIQRLRREVEELRRAQGGWASAERGDRQSRREGPRDADVRRETEEPRDRPREEGDRRPAERGENELRGIFVKRTEVKIGDYGFQAIVVRPAGRDEPVTLAIPRRNEDLNYAARQLREGQEIGAVWVEEDGQRWLRRLQK